MRNQVCNFWLFVTILSLYISELHPIKVGILESNFELQMTFVKNIKIVLINLMLLSPCTLHAQEPDYYSLCNQKLQEAFQVNSDSKTFHSGVLLYLGSGVSIFKHSLIISPDLIWDLNEHINLLTGIDVYIILEENKSPEVNYSFNFIPYYVLKLGNKSKLRLGAGAAYYQRRFNLIISDKFDYEFTGNNYLGIEFKSLVPIPPPTEHSTAPPLLLILLNYTIRLP